MSRVAILDPGWLPAKELNEALARRSDLASEVRLLTSDRDRVGTLSDAGGAAAFLQAFDADALAGIDTLFIGVGPGADVEAELAAVPAAVSVVVLGPDRPVAGTTPVVAPIRLEEVRRGARVVSPHPAVIALAHLLAPLTDLELEDAVATLLLPASLAGEEGVDELLSQTRSILAFQELADNPVFGQQLAFNLIPRPGGGQELGAVLAAVLDLGFRPALQTLQAGVFHGLTVSLFVRVRRPGTEAGALLERLEASGSIVRAEDDERAGPIAAAGRERLVLGAVEAQPARPGAFWIHAVMDNLTVGGTANVLAIAARLQE